ncbi:MAG: AraC family transcriptional regulator [Actinomycetia bacterium]|nr:AraC family transcriptional regulator [Actinomycetes bacterium]
MDNDETIQKAIDYIEEYIKDDITLVDIAQHVNFSVPHFYRIFKAIIGDTVKTYILKRRLSLAADSLKVKNTTISKIAYEYGFESHDVFTRAFYRIYGILPSKFRNVEKYPTFEKYVISRKVSISDERRIHMKYSVVDIPKIILVGMECAAKSGDSDGAIGRLWSVFLDSVETVRNLIVPNVMYGICECETWDDYSKSFTYMASVAVSKDTKAPKGMTKRIIKPQKYIQTKVPESVKTSNAYSQTFEFIKQNGYESLTKTDELEVYEEIFKDPENHEFMLLTPIK